jgi:cytidine deaminase
MPDAAPPLDLDAARALLRQAADARRNAYVPYSRFTVGAALLTAGGEVVTGCNVENASYGLANCAERTAVFTAVARGIRDFRAVAIVGLLEDEPCAPCGACRQVLYEFAPDLQVITPGTDGEPSIRSLRELLPHAFDPRVLPGVTR